MATPTWTARGRAYSSRGSEAEKGRPVISTTSSARTTRRPLSGRIRSAASGSTLGQPPVQRPGPDLGQLGLEPRADGLVGAGELEAVEHGPGVERRPPDQHRGPAGRAQVGHHGPGPALELRDAGRLGDVEDVEEVVGDAAALGGRQLGGADVHAAVELHGVGVDDLPAQGLGEVERERRLAGRRGPDDRHHGWTGVGGHGR